LVELFLQINPFNQFTQINEIFFLRGVQMPKFLPKLIILMVSFVVLLGLACSLSGGGDPTATLQAPVMQEEPIVQEPIQVEQPTQIVQPTQPVMPTLIPTNTQAQPPTQVVVTQEPVETEEPVGNEAPAYFTEEFNGDMDNWSYFLMNGNEMDMDLYADEDSLVFDLRGNNQYVYVIYDPYYYSDVFIEISAENKGKNTNNVSLICNYSDEYGWYEFNITNGGLYNILVYDEIDGEYVTLASGGSVHVKTGRNTNIYSATCYGNQLALYINGFLETEHFDNIYNLKEGQVGVSVSSFDVLPILVEIDYFDIQ
jgi:hypothetical protein